MTVYLKEGAKAKEAVAVDSTVVANGVFQFTGDFDMLTERFITVGDRNERLLLDSDTVNVAVTTEQKLDRDSVEYTAYTIDVTGGPELSMYLTGNSVETGCGLLQMGPMFAALSYQRGTLSEDSLKIFMEQCDSLLKNSIEHYVDTSKTYRAGTFFIRNYMFRSCSFDEVKSACEGLSDEVKASKEGKALLADFDKVMSVNVGGTPADFTLPDPEGNDLKLSQFRGKILLLDFWASWCGPCRAEMPNVKDIYAKYHDKGLEILGVSLDESKDKWVDAIAKEELPWSHVSALKGWDCPVAKQFNVTGIPRMYILDTDGKIIAQDLRGEELQAKMAELFAGK